MDGVRSWVVGVARLVVCGYLYPKMVGLWGWIAGVRDIAIDGCRLCLCSETLSSFIATEYNG